MAVLEMVKENAQGPGRMPNAFWAEIEQTTGYTRKKVLQWLKKVPQERLQEWEEQQMHLRPGLKQHRQGGNQLTWNKFQKTSNGMRLPKEGNKLGRTDHFKELESAVKAWMEHLQIIGLELSPEDLMWEYEVRLEAEVWDLKSLGFLTAEKQKRLALVEDRLEKVKAQKTRQHYKQKLLTACGVQQRMPSCVAPMTMQESEMICLRTLQKR